jgi:hypothetical protein
MVDPSQMAFVFAHVAFVYLAPSPPVSLLGLLQAIDPLAGGFYESSTTFVLILLV